jgi:hypothetical protein
MSAASPKRGRIITANEEGFDMRMLPPVVPQIRNQALEEMIRFWVNSSCH